MTCMWTCVSSLGVRFPIHVGPLKQSLIICYFLYTKHFVDDVQVPSKWLKLRFLVNICLFQTKEAIYAIFSKFSQQNFQKHTWGGHLVLGEGLLKAATLRYFDFGAFTGPRRDMLRSKQSIESKASFSATYAESGVD